MPPAERKMIGAHIPPSLAEDLKKLAASRERSVSAEVRLAVSHWVASNRDEIVNDEVAA